MTFGQRKPTDAEQVPCPHMKNVISPLADGTLGGLMLWYAKQHIAGCERCAEALAAMVQIRFQLAQLSAFNVAGDEAEDFMAQESPRRAAFFAKLDELDAQTTTSFVN